MSSGVIHSHSRGELDRGVLSPFSHPISHFSHRSSPFSHPLFPFSLPCSSPFSQPLSPFSHLPSLFSHPPLLPCSLNPVRPYIRLRDCSHKNQFLLGRFAQKAIYFSWLGPELFCLLLGPPGFNCWFSSGVVRHPRDLQVSVTTRCFCRVLIFVLS